MGTTEKGIQYPEPLDFVTAGATAMRTLAEDVDQRLGGSLFRATVENETVANDADDVLDIQLTTGDADMFTDNGNNIEYTGPDATAILTAQVRWEADAAGYRQMEIRQNNVEVVKIKDTPDGGADSHIQNLTWILRLTSGDTMGLAVRQNSGSGLDVLSGKLRCAVLGV